MLDRTQARLSVILGIAALALANGSTNAQRILPQPVTDSSAQASPLSSIPSEPVNDASVEASPISAGRSNTGPYVVPQTPIAITLTQAIDSGSLQQGEDVKAHLSTPLQVRGGPALPAGTPVQLSVIASAPAGLIMPQGEFSLQLLRVGKVNVYTDTLVFEGKAGQQDLPDSNPGMGTDAGLPSGAALTFRVLPPPTDAVSIVQNIAGPGAVYAVSPGATPPASQARSTYSTPNALSKGSVNGQARSVTPADTTTNQQIQHLGQGSPAPSQMTSPTQPIGGTTPR